MEKNYISKLHNSTKRNYIRRMNDSKVKCMGIAKKYERDYWDGNRRYGYGGYKYIPGRWTNIARNLIKCYDLKSNSKILDVGCGKGYLLKEIKKQIPDIKVYGFDISKYALRFIDKNYKKNFFIHKAQDNFPFKSKYFDLVISLGTLHNLKIFDLHKSIKEIQRVGKKKYIMVESYRNNKELFNLQCWALTCETFFSKGEWKWFFKHTGYTGDFEFIYFI